MPREHTEENLPVWAQHVLTRLRTELQQARDELERTRNASAVLVGRNGWFVIPGPPEHAQDRTGAYHLFYLSREGAHPACTLRAGDTLLVGRKDRE